MSTKPGEWRQGAPAKEGGAAMASCRTGHRPTAKLGNQGDQLRGRRVVAHDSAYTGQAAARAVPISARGAIAAVQRREAEWIRRARTLIREPGKPVRRRGGRHRGNRRHVVPPGERVRRYAPALRTKVAMNATLWPTSGWCVSQISGPQSGPAERVSETRGRRWRMEFRAFHQRAVKGQPACRTTIGTRWSTVDRRDRGNPAS